MMQTSPTKYARPRDPHGLLALYRKKTLPARMDQLAAFLAEAHASSVLDAACMDGLHTLALPEYLSISAADESEAVGKLFQKRPHGWLGHVPFRQGDAASLEQAYPEQFDAVLFLNNEIARYDDPDDLTAALRALLDRMNRSGVLIIGVMDFEAQRGADGGVIPLLLGEEHKGKRCSLLQSVYKHPEDYGEVTVRYIYHMEDLSTNAITVDWEDITCVPIIEDDMFCYVKEMGAIFHKEVVVGHDRLIVYRLEPPTPREYLGPKSAKKPVEKPADRQTKKPS